jgi:putative ABC transport system permease protein
MDALLRDLRAAFRALLRKPAVTALAVASLGLAIGFSTAAFSVLDAYKLRDLPVREPSSLAGILATTREQRGDDLTWIEYEALASKSRSFSGILAEGRRSPKVKLPDRDDFPITAGVSDNYFDLLGVRASMGDVFHEGKGQDGTVVITHHYWKQMLGSDPGIIGRSLQVGRGTLRVIGVAPPGFTGTVRGLLVDLFVPPQTMFGSVQMAKLDDIQDRNYELVARLRPGMTPQQAQTELDPILRQVEKDGLAPGPGRKSSVSMFAKDVRGKLESNAVMLGIVGLLILIAAANLANLRLVENQSRRQETGIRLALGAGRGSLARQHLTETLLVSGIATAAGLLLARWLISAAPALFYTENYIDFGIRFDARTFAFSSGALLIVSIIGALIPWSDAWRHSIVPSLQGARITRSTRWLSALVVVQMALVTGVTCSAGLLWRSLANLSAIRPAMDPDRRLLLIQGYFTGAGSTATARTTTLASALGTLPGVERIAWARRAMLSGSGGGATVGVEIPGQPKTDIAFNQVSPGYFAATGARVLSGRTFSDADSKEAAPVVMVTQTFVKRFFMDQPPIGAWVKIEGRDRQIVGVVEDGPQNHLRETIRPFAYFPFAQMPARWFTYFVETHQDPTVVADSVRDFLRAADKTFTLTDMTSLRRHMRNARSEEEVAAQVTGGLAVVGLLLAAAGLFGVTLYAVAKRTPEFGVRMAMGAAPARLLRQVLREAVTRVAIAIPLGWAIAFAGRHAIQKILFGVAADDPWTFAGASLVVAAVGCAAALHPAVRAAKVDPILALRHE